MYMNAQFTLCHAGINFIGRVYMGKIWTNETGQEHHAHLWLLLYRVSTSVGCSGAT